MISTDTSANVSRDGVLSHEPSLRFLNTPRALSLGWLATYLAASGILLGLSGNASLSALHAAIIAIALWSMTPRGATGRRVGDLLPLVVAPLLYGEIPRLIAALGTTYHDALLQRWELALFGGQPARTLASVVPVRAVSEILHLGYLAYYPSIFLPALVLYARREMRGFAETVLALTVITTLCWTIFALMPVEGPRYLWGMPPDVPDGPIRRLTTEILIAGSSRGAAFPSSHMAVMIGQTALAFRWQQGMAWCLGVVSLLVAVGAVYGGFHYATDMVAGALLGGVSATMLLRAVRHTPSSTSAP